MVIFSFWGGGIEGEKGITEIKRMIKMQNKPKKKRGFSMAYWHTHKNHQISYVIKIVEGICRYDMDPISYSQMWLLFLRFLYISLFVPCAPM